MCVQCIYIQLSWMYLSFLTPDRSQRISLEDGVCQAKTLLIKSVDDEDDNGDRNGEVVRW